VEGKGIERSAQPLRASATPAQAGAPQGWGSRQEGWSPSLRGPLHPAAKGNHSQEEPGSIHSCGASRRQGAAQCPLYCTALLRHCAQLVFSPWGAAAQPVSPSPSHHSPVQTVAIWPALSSSALDQCGCREPRPTAAPGPHSTASTPGTELLLSIHGFRL
jgi:hypothetical protein